MAIYFNELFDLDASCLDKYGALNVSLVADLPLFIDPFLLFNSKKAEYRQLHDAVIGYLVFLRDKAAAGEVPDPLLKAWYCFKEVKQTWLGFSKTTNTGSGLGMDFAKSLHSNLHRLFADFGAERVTKGSHLEKLCLIREGVGRDNISDFTTNLIKDFLCRYTEDFARDHLKSCQVRQVAVEKTRFDFDAERWMPASYRLPYVNGDYVILTPRDMLTRDENWINKHDLIEGFEAIPTAIPDNQLRLELSNYFQKILVVRKGKEPLQRDLDQAARQTILQFPQLIDFYIKFKEEHGDEAQSLSDQKVTLAERLFIIQLGLFQNLLRRETDFYRAPDRTYDEAMNRLRYMKDVIENKGGHRIFYQGGKPIQREQDVHVMFRLVWYGTSSDVSAEANDGRGPADYKISRCASDKTIVEMKLAKNSRLESNLRKQVEIYKQASGAKHGIKAIVFFTLNEKQRVERILKGLGLSDDPSVVLIDARGDNKPSGSKA